MATTCSSTDDEQRRHLPDSPSRTLSSLSSTRSPLSTLSSSMLLLLFGWGLCFCLVDAANIPTVCLGSNCLLASPTFSSVFPDYLPSDIGYDYTVTLFRFFLALVCILVAVWLLRWWMDVRVAMELADALRDNRVVRIPPEWASARNAVTRDVIAAWMARQDKPIEPTTVSAIQVPVHLTMAAAKLHVAPGSSASGMSMLSPPQPPLLMLLPSPSGGGGGGGGGGGLPLSPSPSPSPLALPHSPMSPLSPLSPSPSPSLSAGGHGHGHGGLEYALKILLSTQPGQTCLVEVFFGVEMKLLVQLISDYDKFKIRHQIVAKKKKTKPKKIKTTARSPLTGGGGGGGGADGTASPSPSPSPSSDLASPSPSPPPPMVVAVIPATPAAATSAAVAASSSSTAAVTVVAATTSATSAITPASKPSPSSSVSARRRAAAALKNGGGGGDGEAPPLVIQTGGLPGTAPSPDNSPSHVTAESESKRHISQLSLREKNNANGNMSPPHTASPRHIETAGGVAAASSSSPFPAGFAAATSAPSSSSSSLSPSPPAPLLGLKGGPLAPLAVLGPHECSGLFRPSEFLFALSPALYGGGGGGGGSLEAPAGLKKQQIVLNFPAYMLRDTLRDHTRCPILIFLSNVDRRGGGGSMAVTTTGDGTAFRGIGELTIVQFAPPASSRETAAAAAAAAARAASLSPSPSPSPSPTMLQLPALAITTVAAPSPSGGGGEDGPRIIVADGEHKETHDNDHLHVPVASPSPSASPTSASLQDSVTIRAKFERQLVVTENDAYEMEELYGLDESDAECIICLTDIRDTILLPCKHVCVCKGCHASIQKCPICRSRIGSFLRFTPKDAKEMEAAAKKMEDGAAAAASAPVAR